MNQDVEKLWELQTAISQLDEREKQMSVKPESFAAVDQEYQAANDEMTKLEGSIEQFSKERRRVEGELMDQQEILKKYQGQLMLVKNQQQYAAAWKEIDAARKHVKELEESTLKNMGETDGIQSQLDERKGGHDTLKARYDAAYKSWQSSLGDLRKEAEALRKKIAEIEKTISPKLLQEFYRIAKGRQNIGMASIVSDSCNGCRTRIRPALFQQLKRGDLVFCEGCRRILYLEKPSS